MNNSIKFILFIVSIFSISNCVTWREYETTETNRGKEYTFTEIRRCVETSFIVDVNECQNLQNFWQSKDYKNLKILISKYGIFNTIKYAMIYDDLDLIYFLEDEMKIKLKEYDKIKDGKTFLSLMDVAELYKADTIIDYLIENDFTEYAYKEGLELEEIGFLLSNYKLVKKKLDSAKLDVIGSVKGQWTKLCQKNLRTKDWNGMTFNYIKQCIQVEYAFTNNNPKIKLVPRCREAYNNCSNHITKFLADLKRRDDLILKVERDEIDKENIRIENEALKSELEKKMLIAKNNRERREIKRQIKEINNLKKEKNKRVKKEKHQATKEQLDKDIEIAIRKMFLKEIKK